MEKNIFGKEKLFGDNDFTPLRNLFNEWMVRGTSKKIRAVCRAKGLYRFPASVIDGYKQVFKEKGQPYYEYDKCYYYICDHLEVPAVHRNFL